MDMSTTAAVLSVVVAATWIAVISGLGTWWQGWVLLDRVRGRESLAEWLKR